MKKIFIALFICTIYFVFSISWSKMDDLNYNLVCNPQLDRFLSYDTTTRCGRLNITNNPSDSIFFRIIEKSNASQKALEICNVLKDSCNVYGKTLLFYDTSYSNNFDTLRRIYGKLIYTNKCP